MSAVSGPKVPGAAPTPQGQLMMCPNCQADSHLKLHSIDSCPTPGVEPLVEVTYSCTACHTLQSHATPFRTVADKVNANKCMGALLAFGDTYLHHGMPMAEVPIEVRRSIRVDASSGAPYSELLDVRITTKMIRCECGFQLELPA